MDDEEFDNLVARLIDQLMDLRNWDRENREVFRTAERIEERLPLRSFDRWRKANPEPQPIRLNPWGC